MSAFKVIKDRYDYNYFKRHYEEAIEKNQKTFLYQGQTILVSYAKYVLEYLKPKYDSKN